MACRALAFLLVAQGLGAPASVDDWSKVVFDSPTSEPGSNKAGDPIISGGMPIGNGETTALVFPVTKSFNTSASFSLREGIHIYLSMTTAMASDMALMPLAIVSIETEPPLGTANFSQSLDLSTATVKISTSVGSVSAWVDATNNKVLASVQAASGTSLKVRASVTSVRPSERFVYRGRCSNTTAAPDERFQSSASASIGLSHRNYDEDIAVLNQPALFNTTLLQQGLSNYTPQLQSSDHWRHRQFGLVMSGAGFELEPQRRDQLISGSVAETFQLTVTTHSAQTDTSDEWRREVEDIHFAHLGVDAETARRAHDDFWADFWHRSYIWVSGGDSALSRLTQRYAQTRYVQAIQAGTWVPIKFNGMVFTAQLPPYTLTSGPNFRQWGSCNWWQNTRLAYWNMLTPADFSSMRTIFDYYLQMTDLLQVRTKAAFNHTGIYVTETATLFGAYDPCDYGTDAAKRGGSDLNFGYEESRWLQFDFGGDAGLPELCTMLLDYYAYTLDDIALRKYLPLLTGTLDFFAKHYGDVTVTKKLTVFPTQALETYQCPILPPTTDNCPTNDHPTIAALHVLTERALELPESMTTAQQRVQWKALRAALPPVPLINESGVLVVSPYETYPKAQHVSNSETPELYSIHPFRYATLGRSLLDGERKVDIAPWLYCLDNSTRRTCRLSDSNTGWTQGLLNAALLGRASKAATMTLDRAKTTPATGYRFPAFMPHMQDYEPSEDHLANMNTALQLMLISPADDGLVAGGALLFPAWPCEWDVDFKVAAPRNTVVSGHLVSGKLLRLTVEPSERRSAITVLPCQKTSQDEQAVFV